MNDKDEEKFKKLKAIMDGAMAEMADVLVDESTLALIEKNVRKAIASKGLTYNVASVKLYLQGFEFALSAMGATGPEGVAPLLMGIKKIVKTLEAPGFQAIEKAMNEGKKE